MLSAAQLDACHARAEALLLPTIREYAALDREVDRARWSHLGSRAGVSAYRERAGSSSGSVALLAVGTLRGAFEAVLDALYCDSTDAMRVQSAVLCPRVRHGRVLHVLQRRSARELASFTGVKRASLRVLGGRVLADRDVLYFEKLAAVRQASGRRMAYHLRESLELPSTNSGGPPSSSKGSSKGSSRGFLSLCCLVEELGDRRVGVFLLGTVDGFGPPMLAAGALADLALAVTRTVELARARQLGALLAACKPPPTRATLSLTKRRVCDVCHGLALVFPLGDCAGCGRQRVCRQCRASERVVVRERISTASFCSSCRRHVDARPTAREPSPPIAVRPSDVVEPDVEPDGVDQELMDSAQSLAAFSLKISRHLTELDHAAEQRVSNLSSLGADELSRVLLSSGQSKSRGYRSDGELEDEEEDAIQSIQSIHSPRRKGWSCATTRPVATQSWSGEDWAARLKAASEQADRTFRLAREHSRTAAAVRAHSRLQYEL